MLSQPDKAKFVSAQQPEMEGLEQGRVFMFMDMRNLPPKARLINAIWSYQRKRHSSGQLDKHKARLCADGSKQIQGIHCEGDTHAPACSWSTVCLVMILAAVLGLHG